MLRNGDDSAGEGQGRVIRISLKDRKRHTVYQSAYNKLFQTFVPCGQNIAVGIYIYTLTRDG